MWWLAIHFQAENKGNQKQMKKSPNVQLKLLTHFSKEQFQNPLPYTIAPTTLNFLPTDLPTYWCDVG